MLDTMSKILAFTMDEKQTLGLVKKASYNESPAEGGGTSQTYSKGISDKLISFFLQDDD
jgi:hypothetical protein